MIGGWFGQVGVPTNTRALGIGGRDQLEAETQRAAAAGRLQADDALVACMRTEQDRPQQLGEALVARAAEIGLGDLRIEQPLLGFLHHLQDRRIARPVAKHADADIDFVRPRVGVDHADQRDQRIVRRQAEDRQGPCLASCVSMEGD